MKDRMPTCSIYAKVILMANIYFIVKQLNKTRRRMLLMLTIPQKCKSVRAECFITMQSFANAL